MKHESTIAGAIILIIVALLVLAWLTWSIGFWWAVSVLAGSTLFTALVIIGVFLLVCDDVEDAKYMLRNLISN
jgi:hypothetical protein